MTTDLAQREHVVYRLFDHEGVLLYVGMTCNLAQRLRHHANDKDKDWWPEVDPTRTTTDPYSSQDEARAGEAAAIKAESPRYNSPRWKPKGKLSPEDREILLAAKAKDDAVNKGANSARSRYRAVVVEALEEYGYTKVISVTGLSMNTLQRWRREGGV